MLPRFTISLPGCEITAVGQSDGVLTITAHTTAPTARAGCISLYGIATMRKPAADIGLGDCVQRVFDRLDQRLDGPCFGPTQTRFEFGPGLFNRVEIRRIGRQPNEPRPARRQPFFYPGRCVGREIIPEHNVPRPQRRTEDVPHPVAKYVAIDGSLHDPGGVEPIEPYGGEHRIVVPIVVGDMIHDPLPRRGPPIAADHRQRRPRFIHEFQLMDVEGVTVSRNAVRRVWTRSVSRSEAWSDFF
jgi:hypothetical protein